MRTNIFKTFLLTFLVTALLLALYYLPPISLWGTQLRKVNILSDISTQNSGDDQSMSPEMALSADTINAKLDSTLHKRTATIQDKIPAGMTAIEDYADSTGAHREMDKFYHSLSKASSGNRPVRVAYYGDSFIEGDILTEDLRNMLQSKFGGKGVGFVDMKSMTSGFRQTIKEYSEGWTICSANDRNKRFEPSRQSISGRYCTVQSEAFAEFSGQKRKYGKQLDTCQVATIYFTPAYGMNLSATINGNEQRQLYACIDSTPDNRRIMHKTIDGKIGKIRWSVRDNSHSTFLGASLESRNGVIVDNLSMRGSDGNHLSKIPASTLSAFNSVRPYDLIILHFGLNVASPKVKNYTYYTKQFSNVIRKFRHAFPEASILVVSVGDRDARNEYGELTTMGGVTNLVAYQRKMASDSKVAFWNLYQAMGGNGSMAKMTKNKMANLDYTHINFSGGKHLAKLLFDALMNGKENYDRRSGI